jgi:hypothetical protein
VLDSELLQISMNAPAAELLIRISCSGWMRRVWTLLEGVLAAPTLHVQLHGGAIKIAELSRAEKQSWEKIGCVAHSLGVDVGIFYEDLTVMRLSFQRWSSSSANAHAFGFALHGFAGRSTSWIGDDYLCLGILMGLDQDAIAKLYDTQVIDRPAVLLGALKDVPHGLLFCPGPKLEKPGLRWAPANLWDARPYMVSRPASLYEYDGIEVTYPGYLLPSFPLNQTHFLFKDRQSEVSYRATYDPALVSTFSTIDTLSLPGSAFKQSEFGIICPTIRTVESGPRNFDRIPSVLILVSRVANKTKHILDIGRKGIYGQYVCLLYLTVLDDGDQDSAMHHAKRAPVHVGGRLKELLRLESLSKMKTEWLDQTWYIS